MQKGNCITRIFSIYGAMYKCKYNKLNRKENVIQSYICENSDINRTIFIVHVKSLFDLKMWKEEKYSKKLESNANVGFHKITYTVFYEINRKGDEDYDIYQMGKKCYNMKIKDFPINKFQQTENEINKIIERIRLNPTIIVAQSYFRACFDYMYYKIQTLSFDE